jgi:DNA-directed RNA polymerase specialized sigma24 family protein
LQEEHQPMKAENESELSQTLPQKTRKLTHKIWTKEEQKLLLDLTLEGKSIEEICHILERTSKSVERRSQHLKLMPFHAKRRLWEDQDIEELKSLEM